MRAAVAILALLASCCGEAVQPGNERQPAEAPANVAAPQGNEAGADPPQTDATLAGMSPGQRRAYQRGLADCRAGRYEPANHPEAYRIGCAAAQEDRQP
jgi:hypothetical protein